MGTASDGVVEIPLAVRVSLLKPWERLFVVGSEECLGQWQPLQGLLMQRSGTDRNVWHCCIRVPSTRARLAFRYFIGHYLDPATQAGAPPLLVVHRWECSAHPRVLHPNLLLSRNGRVLRDTEDSFGMIDGRACVHDGWLIHPRECSFFLRIHGKALQFYQHKYMGKEYRLKIVPFDVRFKEKGEEDAEDDVSDPAPPDFPSFSSTELSVLTREDPIFGEQYENGSIFRNDVDYLVFRTRTVSLEHLGFRIELFSAGDSASPSTRLGVAYAMPAALAETYGKTTLPIINAQSQRPLGQVNVDFMLARSLVTENTALRDDASESFARHWKKRSTLEIGHRGCGSSYTKHSSARENTLKSLQEAGRKGADLVEFDVHLTKDRHAVVYHDFHVLIEVANRRNGTKEEEEERPLQEMAIKDLKLSQLSRLHFEHISAVTSKLNACSSLTVTPAPEDKDLDHSPFPPLANVLAAVDESLGFNIEIKYPMLMKGGQHECRDYFERNEFCDVILNEVLSLAGSRRVLFSSFDPDICTLLSQKQHRFPVLFLVVGATARYEPFEDIRSDCSRLAVNYAAGSRLLGVNFHSEELLKDRSPFDRARKFGLVSFVWGDDVNEKWAQQFFKGELGVDGIIYDRIGDEEPRMNTFLVERQAKKALFEKTAASPASSRPVSRRSSLESIKAACDAVPASSAEAPPSSPPSSPSSSSSPSVPSSSPRRSPTPSRTPKLYVRSSTMKQSPVDKLL